MSSYLEDFEQAVADRLEAVPYFADITVLVDPQKNIVSEITSKIAKLQLLVAPFVSGADDGSPNLAGPFWDRIQLTVGVFHHPVIGAATKAPREVCEQVCAALKGWAPANLSGVLVPDKPSIELVADARLNIWNCNFKARGGFYNAMTQLPAVTHGANGLLTTLACATAGAAIFYTVDGTTPMPLAATGPGLLYTAPVALGLGTAVKARAFLAGYLHSDIISFIAP
jgi:hypothetical protein